MRADSERGKESCAINGAGGYEKKKKKKKKFEKRSLSRAYAEKLKGYVVVLNGVCT